MIFFLIIPLSGQIILIVGMHFDIKLVFFTTKKIYIDVFCLQRGFQADERKEIPKKCCKPI